MAEQDTSGFYKKTGISEKPNSVFWAPNFVNNKDFDLYRSDKDVYTYPVDGWYWFDSIHDMCTGFGLNIDDVEYW